MRDDIVQFYRTINVAFIDRKDSIEAFHDVVEDYLFLEAETVIDLNKIRDFLNDKVWKKCVTYEKYREKV